MTETSGLRVTISSNNNIDDNANDDDTTTDTDNTNCHTNISMNININMITMDLWYYILQYCNVIDMGQLCCVSQYMYYMIYQYKYHPIVQRFKVPQCIAVASSPSSSSSSSSSESSQIPQYTAKELYHKSLLQLQDEPNLVLSFTSADSLLTATSTSARTRTTTATAAPENTTVQQQQPQVLHEILQQRLPHDTIVLGAIADHIQSTGIVSQPPVATSNNNNNNKTPMQQNNVPTATCECTSNDSLMMLSGLTKKTSLHYSSSSTNDNCATAIPTTKTTSTTKIQPFLLACNDDDDEDHDHSNTTASVPTPADIEQYINDTFTFQPPTNYSNLNNISSTEQPPQQQSVEKADEWKVVVLLYAVNDGINIADTFISMLQKKYPTTVITFVGGICHAAYISIYDDDNDDDDDENDHNDSNNDTNAESKNKSSSQVPQRQGIGSRNMPKNKRNMKYKFLGMNLNPNNNNTTTNDTIEYISGGICGVVLAGNVPVRSVVSRGVESLSYKYYNSRRNQLHRDTITLTTTRAASNIIDPNRWGTPKPYTSLYVHESQYFQYGDVGYMLSGESPPPYHLIYKIRDEDDDYVDGAGLDNHLNVGTTTAAAAAAAAAAADTNQSNTNTGSNNGGGRVYTINELLHKFGHPDFIGLRYPNQDGFSLESPHPISSRLNALLMISPSITSTTTTTTITTTSTTTNTDIDDTTSSLSLQQQPPSLVGANIDFFNLSGIQCIQDMEYCMDQLRIQTSNEEILGAIMFSCNGRGPHPGVFVTEEMADAKRFADVFPTIPCLGFYAGGEIGPLALAGRQSVFQQGNACVQGFTAVFALFIVPQYNHYYYTILKNSYQQQPLDDSEDCIRAFIQARFYKNTK